jgi:hypothetical protein
MGEHSLKHKRRACLILLYIYNCGPDFLLLHLPSITETTGQSILRPDKQQAVQTKPSYCQHAAKLGPIYNTKDVKNRPIGWLNIAANQHNGNMVQTWL